MRLNNYLIGCCVLLFLPARGTISVVYNLRIAETSKRFEINPTIISSNTFGTGTLFGTFRKKYDDTIHRCGGGLFTLMYAPESFFIRVDGAVARVASITDGVHFNRTQADDLLFSAGYSPKIADSMRITFSGLVGFPLHNDTSLDFVQFGYGHYGLGAQVDGSFLYSHNRNHILRCAVRCIHFFPREIHVTATECAERFKYTIGNLVDLFIGFHNKRKPHAVEIGYNPSFFFDAHIHPAFDDAIEKSNYNRNQFYGIYNYRFWSKKRTHKITYALSYGFDSVPEEIGNKRIITTWASWSVNF